MLDLHDDTSCVSDVGLRYNDITVIVDVSEESVASEVHDTVVSDHVYAWTPLVPENNYCRLLTSPGNVPTPQLSNENQNPIPTNPRSIPVCLHFFVFIGVSVIYCLFSHATYPRSSCVFHLQLTLIACHLSNFNRFPSWPLLIPCLYQRATCLTIVELQAASLGDVPTFQLSRGSNTTNHAADPQWYSVLVKYKDSFTFELTMVLLCI